MAYRTEENFVSVVPQATRLKIYLNIPFADLQDTKGVCRDVINTGHWATGDAELDFADKDDLPYVMGLIRQAFEWRMDEGGAD